MFLDQTRIEYHFLESKEIARSNTEVKYHVMAATIVAKVLWLTCLLKNLQIVALYTTAFHLLVNSIYKTQAVRTSIFESVWLRSGSG